MTGKVLLEQDFKVEFELKNINPVYQQIRIRDKAFWSGVIMSVLAAVVLEILHSVLEVPWSHSTAGLMLVFIVSGILLCSATVRKVEFYTFTNRSGTPEFSIARPRKNKEVFDSFISNLVAAINNAQEIREQISETNRGETPCAGK